MYNRILVLAPHTDDGELGCGGAIAKFVEEGKQITVVAFSTAEESVPAGFPKDALEGEFRSAMAILGVPNDNLIVYKFRVRHFPSSRQEILEKLVKLRSLVNPDLVFLPSPNDIHQDHQVITAEGLRTFKKISILGYELPWNNIMFETKSFIPLERRHIEKKISALECYKTQQHRSYLNKDFIFGLAKTRGTQFENDFAESFEVLRLIL